MENIIKINKLGYNYGEGWILHDLSVEIAQGDFVAVIGPNGAGKSTLLRLLAGILQPTSGEIELYGTPLPQFKAWEKIGYVPQNPAKQHRDFPISVKEVIGLGLLCGSSMFQKISRAGKARVETMLERFYLQELAHRKIGELSGGQQQRVFWHALWCGSLNCCFWTSLLPESIRMRKSNCTECSGISTVSWV